MNVRAAPTATLLSTNSDCSGWEDDAGDFDFEDVGFEDCLFVVAMALHSYSRYTDSAGNC